MSLELCAGPGSQKGDGASRPGAYSPNGEARKQISQREIIAAWKDVQKAGVDLETCSLCLREPGKTHITLMERQKGN